MFLTIWKLMLCIIPGTNPPTCRKENIFRDKIKNLALENKNEHFYSLIAFCPLSTFSIENE